MENKLKHLEFIQDAITRMAGNLFLVKGWTITLIAALFALSAKDSNRAFILIAYFPAIVFWGLDGYFLSHERRYRDLYDHVRQLPAEQIDFSMNTSAYVDKNTWLDAIFSRTLLIYYGSLVASMLVLHFFIRDI